MYFDERSDGDYRIYAGALEAPRHGGYIAAVVVNRLFEAGRPHEVFRDDSLHCGHRWPSAEAALGQAVTRGRQVIARERQERAVLELERRQLELEAAAEHD
ncbi:MAG: hypothetical protein RLZZ618_4134 [Pseudomonadota bacterium]